MHFVCYCFQNRETKVGLAADLGSLQRLPKYCMNQSWVMDVCLSARDFPAHEALTNGLVSRTIPGDREKLIREALNYAGNIAKLSPVAIVGTKRALLHIRDNPVASGTLLFSFFCCIFKTILSNGVLFQLFFIEFQGLNQIAEWNMAMLQTGDIPKALQATMAKQTPVFSKL